MAIRIVEADLDRDRPLITNALRKYLNPQADQRRFDWLYINNPYGRARAWLAINDQEQVIGTSAIFPRLLASGGTMFTAWVLGDFCLHANYRTLGPALQLQKACLSSADSAGIDVCYDFPSISMQAIYQRMGLKPRMQMVRFAKILRVNRQVAKLVTNAFIGQAMSAPLNLLLRVYEWKRFCDPYLTFSLHKEVCREEFSELSEKVGNGSCVYIVRSSRYLNWRYLASPLYSYEIITARRGKALVGYCVFYQVERDAGVVDLVGINNTEVFLGLVANLEEVLRCRGVEVLSISVAERHPLVPLLWKLGFKARESSPIMIIVSEKCPSQCLSSHNDQWWLMAGDRDS